MNIHEFANTLANKLTAVRLAGRFVNEQAFESDILVGAAWDISRANPDIRVFSHPWGRKAKCRPSCRDAASDFDCRVEGCPACWKNSKQRSVADAFGTRNNFDLAAVDRQNGSLVVEVKWLTLAGNKGPNGEFQRFIGQCTLAASANDVVIGVCGLWGRRLMTLDRHEEALREAVRKIGVDLIVLRGEM